MAKRNPVSLTPEALFRYRIVSAVKGQLMAGHPLVDAVRLTADEIVFDSKGVRRQLTSRTLYRWRAAFEYKDLRGLEPSVREPLKGSLVLSPAQLEYLETEHIADREASIPELLKRARAKGLIRLNEKIHRGTVWRVFQRLGHKTARHIRPKYTDMRRFEYTHRMQMVLVDGKHFRAGPHSVRRVAVYFIDAATAAADRPIRAGRDRQYLRAHLDVFAGFCCSAASIRPHGRAVQRSWLRVHLR